MPDPLNIVYFVCHDLGKHLGCYDALVHSPHLNAFAADSVQFDRAFCSSTACSPSRACAMTGQHAHTHGEIGLSHMGWSLRPEVRTIVDELNDAGYETAHSGLAHERLPETMPYQVEMEEDWDDWNAHVAVDKAIEYLRNGRDGSRPFYLNIGTQQPHASTWGKAEQLYGGPVPPDEVWVPPYTPDTAALRERFGRFEAAIRYVDQHFQRLIDVIDALGLDRNTLVIFTTDHGIANARSKGTLYDRGMEIALLARLPKEMRRHERVGHLIQNIDLAPTLLDWTGAAIPERMQGRSFRPLLTGEPYEPHEQICTERNCHGERAPSGEGYVDRYDPQRAIRTDGFHYIRRFRPEIKPRPWLPWEVGDGDGKTGGDPEQALPERTEPRAAEELYHIAHDPLELINVADRPEYRSIKTDLAGRLEAWMERTGDFLPDGEPPARPDEPGWGKWA